MILNIRYAQPISLLFHNLKIERDRIDFLDSLHKKILLLHRKEIWMCYSCKRKGSPNQNVHFTKMAIRTEFTFFTLDVYHAIMMKIEPTDRLYTPSDNPYIHLKNYQVTYHDAKQGYTEVFQVRRVGFMYFCVDGVTGP